jgi:hypothetical protein
LFGDAQRQYVNRIGSDPAAARQLRQSRHLQLLREPRRLPARLFRQLRGASLPAHNRLIEKPADGETRCAAPTRIPACHP